MSTANPSVSSDFNSLVGGIWIPKPFSSSLLYANPIVNLEEYNKRYMLTNCHAINHKLLIHMYRLQNKSFREIKYNYEIGCSSFFHFRVINRGKVQNDLKGMFFVKSSISCELTIIFLWNKNLEV